MLAFVDIVENRVFPLQVVNRDLHETTALTASVCRVTFNHSVIVPFMFSFSTQKVGMTYVTEQRVCLNCCFLLAKLAVEVYQILQHAFKEDVVSRTRF